MKGTSPQACVSNTATLSHARGRGQAAAWSRLTGEPREQDKRGLGLCQPKLPETPQPRDPEVSDPWHPETHVPVSTGPVRGTSQRLTRARFFPASLSSGGRVPRASPTAKLPACPPQPPLRLSLLCPACPGDPLALLPPGSPQAHPCGGSCCLGPSFQRCHSDSGPCGDPGLFKKNGMANMGHLWAERPQGRRASRRPAGRQRCTRRGRGPEQPPRCSSSSEPPHGQHFRAEAQRLPSRHGSPRERVSGGVTSSPAWLLEGHDSLVKGGPQTQKKVQLTRTRDDRRRVTPEIRTKTRPGSLAPRASRGRSQDRMRAVTRPPAAGPSSPSQPGSGEGPGVGVCRCLSLRREGAPRSLGAGLPWDQAQAGPARGAPLCSARRWGARGPERSLICSSTCLVWAQKRGRLRCQM